MPLGWGGETGGATLSPELLTDEERKDRGRREKKGLASRNLQSASCLKLNRNWERGMEDGAGTICLGKEGAFLPAGQAQARGLLSTDPCSHACLLPSCVARGQAPAARMANKDQWIFIP